MPKGSTPPAKLSLAVDRPRAWSPKLPLDWNGSSPAADPDRRARFAETVRWLRWRPVENGPIDFVPVFDEELDVLARGEQVFATGYSSYHRSGHAGSLSFVGIAVGTAEPNQLRFYLPEETGTSLLATKPLEHELLSDVEKALVVPAANIDRPNPYKGQEVGWRTFRSTSFIDSDTKRSLAAAIVDFVDSGFPANKHRGLVTKHLPDMFWLDRAHSDRVFYAKWFSTATDQARFLEQVIRTQPSYGNGHDGNTLSDVEYEVAEVIIDRGYLPAYQRLAVKEQEADARSLYESLKRRFEPAHLQTPVSALSENKPPVVRAPFNPKAAEQAPLFEL